MAIALALAVLAGITYVSARPSRPGLRTSPLKAGEVSFWNGTVAPRLGADPDTVATELGTRFSTSTPGVVTAILFYKFLGNAGPHTGTLWDSAGRKLASVAFGTESGTGWQVARLAQPVRLAAGTGYVVSYQAPHGQYADDTGYFRPGRTHTAGPLTATAGVYRYGTTAFPTSTWEDSTYYVDVAFRPDAVGGPTATGTATPTITTGPTMNPPSSTAPSTTASGSPTATSPSSSSTAPGPGPGAGSGCAAVPSHCGYPDATNTGIPAGVSLRKSGSVTASKSGQVIEGLDITGEINVAAPNVVIKNTRVTGDGDWVVIVRPGADNLTIEDSELMTPPGTPQDIACVLNVGDSLPRILRANIHNCSAGISSGGGLVQDSYIHDMSQKPGLSHDVGIASNGGGGMTITHNTIFNQLDQTAAIAFYQDFGTQHDDTVSNNLLAGGGYCVYGGTGNKGGTQNIRFLNNRFSRKYHANCGYFGTVADFRATDPGNAWTGNIWDEDGRPA